MIFSPKHKPSDLRCRLCHAPNVPGLIRFFGAYHAADKGQIAVVLEYMDGGSLADVLTRVGGRAGGWASLVMGGTWCPSEHHWLLLELAALINGAAIAGLHSMGQQSRRAWDMRAQLTGAGRR